MRHPSRVWLLVACVFPCTVFLSWGQESDTLQDSPQNLIDNKIKVARELITWSEKLRDHVKALVESGGMSKRDLYKYDHNLFCARLRELQYQQESLSVAKEDTRKVIETKIRVARELITESEKAREYVRALVANGRMSMTEQDEYEKDVLYAMLRKLKYEQELQQVR